MGVQMLVSDYLDQVIKSRPYKYSTKQSLIRDVKRLGIADLDTSEITSALIRDKVDCIPNHNSRRRLYITARSIFKDLGVCQDLPKMEGISRIYNLPNHDDLHDLIDQSKYRLQLFLCMYAGLRVGEACAVTLVCDFHRETSQVLAKAVTDVTYLSIPLSKVDDWLRKYKSWHYFVIRTYRSRYEELLQTIQSIAFKKMDERLESYLMQQVKQFGNTLPLTHQEIATDLNSSREVISRLMKKMEKNGWIILHRNSIEWIKK